MGHDAWRMRSEYHSEKQRSSAATTQLVLLPKSAMDLDDETDNLYKD